MPDEYAIRDIGPKPQSFDLEQATRDNKNYRTVAKVDALMALCDRPCASLVATAATCSTRCSPKRCRRPRIANWRQWSDKKESHAMNRYASLILFLVLVLGGGLVLGFLTAPGEWYAGLAKPSFNPPAWLFGPVWTVLYILIAIAGWRVWRRDRTGWPMKLWWVQLALNFLWTPVFFAAHQLGLALAVILLMLAAILGFIATAWRQDRVAAWLFVPYAAWGAFASALNGAICALN